MENIRNLVKDENGINGRKKKVSLYNLVIKYY